MAHVYKKKEVTGDWRKLYNKELQVLYSSPSMIRVRKCKRARYIGYVACNGQLQRLILCFVKET
jgi:hypothetical protein